LQCDVSQGLILGVSGSMSSVDSIAMG